MAIISNELAKRLCVISTILSLFLTIAVTLGGFRLQAILATLIVVADQRCAAMQSRDLIDMAGLHAAALENPEITLVVTNDDKLDPGNPRWLRDHIVDDSLVSSLFRQILLNIWFAGVVSVLLMAVLLLGGWSLVSQINWDRKTI